MRRFKKTVRMSLGSVAFTQEDHWRNDITIIPDPFLGYAVAITPLQLRRLAQACNDAANWMEKEVE